MLCPNHLILSCSLSSGPSSCPSFSLVFPTFIFSQTLPSTSLNSHHETHATISSMAKLGKLTKLKSAIKRWPSFPKLGRSTASHDEAHQLSTDQNDQKLLHAVYVGKSRRRYLVNSDVLEHPVFQELVDRSEDGAVVVACEVVLFEHLLWMLENAETRMGSMDDLAEFYTCAC